MTDNADSMFDIASRHTMKSKGGMTNRSKKSKMNTSFVTTRTKKSKAASRKSMKSSILGESLHPIQNEEESSSEESDSRASSYHSAKDDLFDEELENINDEFDKVSEDHNEANLTEKWIKTEYTKLKNDATEKIYRQKRETIERNAREKKKHEQNKKE